MKRIPLQSVGLFLLGLLMLLVPLTSIIDGYTGLILIARDSVGAPFDKALILIDHHNVDGAVGIIINKPLSDEQKAELPPFLKNAGVPVGYGGPIGFPDRIIVLEEKPWRGNPHEIWFDINDWDDVVLRTPGLLDEIKQDAKTGSKHFRVFAGLASWAPLQLEAETALNNAWYTVPPSHARVFQQGADTAWGTLYHAEEDRKKTAAASKI